MSKDLIKENGNQATIGSIPQLLIPRDLGSKLIEGTAVWADFEAAGITREFIKDLIANSRVPRFVLQTGNDTNYVIYTGSGGYIRAQSGSSPTLAVEAGALAEGEAGYKAILEFAPWSDQYPFSFHFAEV